MVNPLEGMPMVLVPAMIGKWRVTMNGSFGDEGGKLECWWIYADIQER